MCYTTNLTRYIVFAWFDSALCISKLNGTHYCVECDCLNVIWICFDWLCISLFLSLLLAMRGQNPSERGLINSQLRKFHFQCKLIHDSRISSASCAVPVPVHVAKMCARRTHAHSFAVIFWYKLYISSNHFIELWLNRRVDEVEWMEIITVRISNRSRSGNYEARTQRCRWKICGEISSIYTQHCIVICVVRVLIWWNSEMKV